MIDQAGLLEARSRIDDLCALARWRLTRRGPQVWQPTAIPSVIDGFDTTIGSSDLHEGCRRLDVMASGESVSSYSRKAIGGKAIASDGTLNWVKVSALRGRSTHWQRDGERAAIAGLPRPALIAECDWVDGDRHWLALQFELCQSPVVERGHWAGQRARKVSDSWIAELRSALATLSGQATERQHASPDRIAELICERFGADAPHVADEWPVAHGDLLWCNLTTPQLELIDWESWGRAPRGLDAAKLVAFSCAYPSLVARLERAFAGDLATRSGTVARLYVLADILDLMDHGWLDTYYRVPIEAMARRVLRRS